MLCPFYPDLVCPYEKELDELSMFCEDCEFFLGL